MGEFLSYTILGISLAGIYAVAASGLVVTYTTSGVFNFADGAMGMLGAFSYWQLSSSQGFGLPAPLAFVIVVLVLAPLAGALIERVIMRGVEDASEVTRLVVTFGLLAAMIALAQILWPPNESRVVERWFAGESLDLAGVSVPYHRLFVVVVAIAVAAGLRFLLYATRTGVTMRAVVDNRSLVELNGGHPGRSSMLSWALGSSLAALAGVLVAEKIGLEVFALTFLVVNAYAAAVFGRLVSLPMTFLGAVVLGLSESYAAGYLPDDPSWMPDGWSIATTLRLAIPIILLFVVLLALPRAPLRGHGLGRLREGVPKPDLRRSLIGAAALVVVVSIVGGMLDPSDAVGWGRGLAYAVIMVSLVPLTGYGGQISLAQLSFAGLGAFAMAEWGQNGNPVGLLAAFVLAAAVGALVALPALRLQGIYLALATLAFAFFVEKVVFTQQALFEGGSRPVDRLSLFGVSLDDDRWYLAFMALVFAAAGIGIVMLRLGKFGRRLYAMKDSPAACATLGMNLTRTKLQVFALSAGIAGVGGALLAMLEGNARPSSYDTLQGLPILLMAVSGGIALVSGSLVGGLLLASFPIVSELDPSLTNPLLLAPGLLGISLGRNPNGMVNEIGVQARALRERAFAGFEPPLDCESLGIDRAFTAGEMAGVDDVLGISEADIAAAGMADPRSASSRSDRSRGARSRGARSQFEAAGAGGRGLP